MAGMVAGSDGQSDSSNPMARRAASAGRPRALFETLGVSKLSSLDRSQQRTLSGLGDKKNAPRKTFGGLSPELTAELSASGLSPEPLRPLDFLDKHVTIAMLSPNLSLIKQTARTQCCAIEYSFGQRTDGSRSRASLPVTYRFLPQVLVQLPSVEK